MRIRLTLFLLFGLGLACGIAQGQGTAVQLPTYSFFSTDTTVSVPDRGSVYLGGVQRASSGSNEFGVPLLPFRNRSIGMERSASSNWVSVTIHDFEAMDEALLNRSTPSYPLGFRPVVPQTVERLPQMPVARTPVAHVPTKSVAEVRAENHLAAETRQQEAASFLARGREAEAAGKANVARIYYQMAGRRATGPVKTEILARLEALDAPSDPPQLAQTEP